jgi:hypothetical protein
VVDALAGVASAILVVPDGRTATNRVGNDYQFDVVIYTAVAYNGGFILSALVGTGHVRGKRKILYQISG